MGGNNSKTEESVKRIERGRLIFSPKSESYKQERVDTSLDKNDKCVSPIKETQLQTLTVVQESRPSTTMDDGEKIKPLLSNLTEHDGSELNENYILNIWGKYLSDKDFIRETKIFRFPKFKQFRLRWLNDFKGDKEMKDVNDFMK